MYLRSDKVFLRVLFALCLFLYLNIFVVYAEEPVQSEETETQNSTPASDSEAVVDSEPVPEPTPADTIPVEPPLSPEVESIDVPVSEGEEQASTSPDTESASDTSSENSTDSPQPEDVIPALTSSTTDEFVDEVVPPTVLEVTGQLTRLEGESSLFSMSDSLVFTLISDTPLKKRAHADDSKSVSFVADIAQTVGDATTYVVESVADVVGAVIDTIVDAVEVVIHGVSGLMSDESTVDSETPSEESTSRSEASTEPVEMDTRTVVEEAPAVEESETLAVRTFIDGVLVSSSYVLLDEHTVLVDVRPDTIEPGVHTVRIETSFEGESAVWEGVCTWGGAVVYSKEVGSGVWAIVLEGVTEGTALFLQEYNGTTFTYSLLDSAFTFAQSSSITVFENTLFWLSLSKDVVYGYDILSRTQFSQSLSQTDESEVTLHEQPYTISTETAEPQFIPIEKILE